MPKSRRDFRSSEIRELIEGARRGETSSLGELLQVYRNYLSVLAATQFKQKLKPRVSPSDVVQETLLRAHKKFGQFKGGTEQELAAWLRAILVNNLAKFVERHLLAERRDVRREISIDHLDTGVENSAVRLAGLLPAAGKSPSTVFQQQEDAAELAERLAKLPENYRQVLVLRNLQELPFDEIAQQLDRSVGATRMLWMRAIEKLRELYQVTENSNE